MFQILPHYLAFHRLSMLCSSSTAHGFMQKEITIMFLTGTGFCQEFWKKGSFFISGASQFRNRNYFPQPNQNTRKLATKKRKIIFIWLYASGPDPKLHKLNRKAPADFNQLYIMPNNECNHLLKLLIGGQIDIIHNNHTCTRRVSPYTAGVTTAETILQVTLDKITFFPHAFILCALIFHMSHLCLFH